MSDDLHIASEKEPKIAQESKAGPAVTGESAASSEGTRGLSDQSMPRSPEGPRQAPLLGLLGSSSERPGFAEWWGEYQEKMAEVPEVAIAKHPN